MQAALQRIAEKVDELTQNFWFMVHEGLQNGHRERPQSHKDLSSKLPELHLPSKTIPRPEPSARNSLENRAWSRYSNHADAPLDRGGARGSGSDTTHTKRSDMYPLALSSHPTNVSITSTLPSLGTGAAGGHEGGQNTQTHAQAEAQLGFSSQLFVDERSIISPIIADSKKVREEVNKTLPRSPTNPAAQCRFLALFRITLTGAV